MARAQEDATHLFALLRELGLARYRWLPQMLWFEFDRVTRESFYRTRLGLRDHAPGRPGLGDTRESPEATAGEMGGFRLETSNGTSGGSISVR